MLVGASHGDILHSCCPAYTSPRILPSPTRISLPTFTHLATQPVHRLPVPIAWSRLPSTWSSPLRSDMIVSSDTVVPVVCSTVLSVSATQKALLLLSARPIQLEAKRGRLG